MSDERDLHKRIEQLNRKRIEKEPQTERESLRRRLLGKKKKKDKPPESSGDKGIVYRRDLPRSQKPKRRPATAMPGIPLEELIPGREVTTDSGGKLYVIEDRLECPDRWRPELCKNLPGALKHAEGPLPRILRDICEETPPSGPESLLFLDLETAGLSSAPLFLIGMLIWTPDGALVRQCLARDYSEERAALELYMQEARERDVIVSFNGKSFDVPFVRVRATTNAVDYCEPPWHLDMLHVSRRAWKGKFRNYKLQTLEHRVCGRRRSGDIFGAEIPAAYHAFVRTGNAAEMSLIIKHNRLDLLTLAELLTKLPD